MTTHSSVHWGFPGSSAAMQESPVASLGQEDSPGEGVGYPIQFSWDFLVAHVVKNSPVMQETWVQSLGWEDPLETA